MANYEKITVPFTHAQIAAFSRYFGRKPTAKDIRGLSLKPLRIKDDMPAPGPKAKILKK